MTGIRFRNPEVRMSAALASAATDVSDPSITLRALLAALGEQGLLVFCGVLAAPFLLPVTVPGMSTVLGLPMLLIGFAVMLSRVPWLPERLLNHSLPSSTVRNVLARVRGWAVRFELSEDRTRGFDWTIQYRLVGLGEPPERLFSR